MFRELGVPRYFVEVFELTCFQSKNLSAHRYGYGSFLFYRVNKISVRYSFRNNSTTQIFFKKKLLNNFFNKIQNI